MSNQFYGILPLLTDGKVITYPPCDKNGAPLSSSKSEEKGPYSIAATGNLFALDVSGYAYAAVHIYGTFSGTVQFEASNDSTNGTDGDWRTVAHSDIGNTGISVDSTTLTSTRICLVPCVAKWLRLRCSAYTSGTINARAVFHQGAVPAPRSVAAVTQASTSGTGSTNSRVAAAASTNATSIKTSSGKLYGYTFYNNTASAKFVKFYNKASAPTVGTDTPVFTIIVPANGQATYLNMLGKEFATGIAYAITGAIADSDTTAVAANDVHGHLDWI